MLPPSLALHIHTRWILLSGASAEAFSSKSSCCCNSGVEPQPGTRYSCLPLGHWFVGAESTQVAITAGFHDKDVNLMVGYRPTTHRRTLASPSSSRVGSCLCFSSTQTLLHRHAEEQGYFHYT